MTSFIYFYFEFEYRKHRSIKRDAKLWSGDAIVSRLEANKQNHDMMHSLTLILKFSVGAGSSNPGSKVPTPIESVKSCPTKGPRPVVLIGSDVPT